MVPPAAWSEPPDPRSNRPENLDDSRWQVPAAEVHELAPRASRYCILIPVLDEGERIRRQLVAMQHSGAGADVIITDGGSTDGSMNLEFLRQHGVRALLIKRGPGRVGAQLRIGFAYCLRQGYEGIVTIDGNGKDGVEALASFLEALDQGYDFVQGSRFAPGGKAINTPWRRLLAIWLLHAPAVSLAARHRYHDTTNGFRAYSRKLLLHPAVQPFRNVFTHYEILWYLSARAPRTGHRVCELPVVRRYPDRGPTPTKITAFKGTGRLLSELWALVRGLYAPPDADPERRSPS